MKVHSSAGIRSRRRFMDPPPQIVTLPVIAGHLNSHPTYGYQARYVCPGMVLTATPGTWEDPGGTPTVVGVWVDWNDEPVLAPGVTVLTVPEIEFGGYFWRETATQNNVSRTHWTDMVEVIPLPAAPVINGTTTPITGSHDAGATITKPTYAWYSPLAVTTAGQWIKNGVATGVSASTYSDTVEGDVMMWQETAMDQTGQSSIPTTGVWPGGEASQNLFGWGQFFVSNIIDDTAAALKAGIDSRISGKAGGSANMKLFSVKNHATSSYTYNPDCWAYDLRQQLSGRAIYKGGMNSGRSEDYGGVLITPRHLLYCEHAFPHAENTWIQPSGPCVVRFILPNGTVVEAIQIHQQRVANADLCVATLDRDVQALGVSVMPILPFSYLEWNTIQGASGTTFPVFSISQGYNAGNEPWSQPVADYPFPDHDVLCYIVDLKNMRQDAGTAVPPVTTYLPFNFAVYDGDSGTAAFALINDTVYLFQITTTNWGGPFVGINIAGINAAIVGADANAIALGRLTVPTGHTVALAPKPTF